MQKLLVTVATVAAIALFAPLSEVKGQFKHQARYCACFAHHQPDCGKRFIIKEIVLKDLNVPKAQAGAPESIGDPRRAP